MTALRPSLIAALVLATTPAAAGTIHCYQGRDITGAPAEMRLQVEQFATFAEIYGVYRSAAVGTMQIKADFGSGAGRAYRRHEYESGAVFINFRNIGPNYSSYVLDVQGYGRFPFSRMACR